MDKSQSNNRRSSIRSGWSRRSALTRLGAGGLAAGFVSARGGDASAQIGIETATTEAMARLGINAINGVLAGGDTAALDRVFAPDYVNHTPHRSLTGGPPYAPDLTGLRGALTDLRAAVPDAVLIVEEVIATRDTAAVRVTFRGSVPARAADSGQSVTFPVTVGGVAIVRVRERLIVESWDYDEFAELFGGLIGVDPGPEEQPTTTEAPGERREIANVDAVSVEGIGTLRLSQGDRESLSIEAEPRVLRRIATEVRDGTLFIQPDRSLRTREPVIYHLAVVNIAAIALSGAVQGEANEITADEFQLSLSGSSGMTIGELSANALAVDSTGNAGASLAGTVGAQIVEFSGSGRYLAADLQSTEASVTVSGAAQAQIQVSDRLVVDISGAASVVYRGDPVVEQSISGAGSLSRAG